MKISNTILAAILFLCSSDIPAQTTKGTNENCKCSVAIVVRTSAHLKLLTKKDVYNLLYTFDDTCSNIEFQEYSNQILFNVLEYHPGIVIELLSGKNRLNKKAIYRALSHPIRHADYSKIRKNLKGVKSNNNVKNKLASILEMDEKKR